MFMYVYNKVDVLQSNPTFLSSLKVSLYDIASDLKIEHKPVVFSDIRNLKNS